ncbi:hypothetical protein MP228_007072 [Amoeboaphelidium protococcarum]|nr:hypothetical protein MP228_007072 [Amoeboaphelidium protococcarum]
MLFSSTLLLAAFSSLYHSLPHTDQLILQEENSSGAAVTPYGYSQKFYGVLAHTKQKGDIKQVQSEMRWYDYPKKSLLNQCSIEGVTSCRLFKGKSIYIFNKIAKQCIKLDSPFPIISPTWILDGEYKGLEFVNGVLSHRWDKMDHFYYESVVERKLTRVFAPLDQNGFSAQHDYVIYEPQESIDERVFEVPAFCQDDQRKDIPEEQKHKLFPCYFNEQQQSELALARL